MKLENAAVRAEADAGRGGAITSLVYRRAIRFPLIARRGAGVAGQGALFALRLELGGRPVRPWPVRGARAGSGVLAFAGSPGPGLEWERRIELLPGASGLVIRDVVRNGSKRSLRAALGLACRQEAAEWRLTDRSWIGTDRLCREISTSSIPAPGAPPPPPRARVTGRDFFWRQVGQYGTGLLCRLRAPEGGTASAEVLPGPGREVRVEWRPKARTLIPGGSLVLETEVLVDEGGGAPDLRSVFGPVQIRADFAAAGRRGRPVHGFATVVSPLRRRVLIEVEREGAGIPASLQTVLIPGRVTRLPVGFIPAKSGPARLRVTVSGKNGPIGTAECAVLIDGGPGQRAWRAFTRTMPEEHYRGTWEEIGAQMARNRRRVGGPTSIEHTVGEIAAPDNDLAFYRRHLPFYAALVAGTARVAGEAPERIGLVKRGQRDKPVACMDVACYGPNGPINAFSKERDGPDYEGLGYVRVLPTRGHAFHVYMHHGVNDAGLTISGATLNEDAATARAAGRALVRWKESGGHTMPPAAGTWMLLAMCRDVLEAVALLRSPHVPWEATGNMLLLDRAGRAARVESAGLFRRIFRHDGKGRGFFAAGNYPHPRPDGSFRLGERWDQAANSLLRERFLADFAGDRQGRLGLGQVLSLMQSHEAGGMCQHHQDNPGQLHTVCSSLAFARTSELWLAPGPPCQVDYIRHRLLP